MTSLKYYLLVLITPLVLSCSRSLDDYENTTPEFDLPTYFDGEVTINNQSLYVQAKHKIHSPLQSV